MKKITVESCAFVQPHDVDLGRVDANKLSDALDVCVRRATLALQRPLAGYSDLQRDNMGLKFGCMQSTFRGVRVILSAGFEKPYSVDALAVARIALEDLYALCLMFEGPQHVSDYLQDGWRKAYVQLLLQGEETKNIARFDEYNKKSAPGNLNSLRPLLGISDAQVHSVNQAELGIPLPWGVKYEAIPQFPTPGPLIAKIPPGDKRKMLERLYMEYSYLCSFAHGNPETTLLKTMFDVNSAVRHHFTPEQRKDTWQRAVAERSFVAALLSVVQAAAELTALYPTDADLCGAVMNAWKVLLGGVLLGQAIWNIRTRKLLRVLDVGSPQIGG